MITSGLEDYLELIYNTISKGEEIKAVDISNEFKISRPSVSEALIRLADRDLIIYEGRKGIKITEKGIVEAKKIIKKHSILCDFFNNILGADFKTASQNACRIEHVIDEELIENIKSFVIFCKENSIDKKFREEKND